MVRFVLSPCFAPRAAGIVQLGRLRRTIAFCQHHRHVRGYRFSSFSSSGENETARPDSESENEVIVLYKRDDNRNNLPRISFLASSFNFAYWIWYVFDFVPAVNSAPIQDLHVDPVYGFAGLGISILIQSAFTLYPTTLISKVAYQPTNNNVSRQQVLVWKHSLPFVQPSRNPTTFHLGDIFMDKTSSDTSKILTEYEGDIQKFQGHLGLGLKHGYIPLLLEIRESHEVCQPQMLLEVLLDPQRLKQASRKASIDTGTNHVKNDRSKHGAKKRGNRGKR
ncbi:hypothetical protein IV203_005811 [Nitzschia inconspicua]|uniref:Uncharacterized protein n=1 Tax=Nitzschia inconspicua TaxID=303405 RepID=A0A9K3KN20_9STRA|nr:hypothetical protein IV203_005811 [Nitzschia inconspicua]